MHRRSLIAGAAIATSIGKIIMSDANAQQKSDPDNTLYIDLKQGRVVIEMFPDIAPKAVERIKTLAREGFYDNTPFHRVIEGFMAQGGDPTGTGTGGSKLPQSDTFYVALAGWRAPRTPTAPIANSLSCSLRRRIWTASTRSGVRWYKAWNWWIRSSGAAGRAALCRARTGSCTCGWPLTSKVDRGAQFALLERQASP
jgi:hypothetical protein